MPVTRGSGPPPASTRSSRRWWTCWCGACVRPAAGAEPTGRAGPRSAHRPRQPQTEQPGQHDPGRLTRIIAAGVEAGVFRLSDPAVAARAVFHAGGRG
ncbi:hypothetical protein [Streptomyces sp. NPDC046870]|uniref:hypothetical protein n=1 Tax=Streptomyces sp. NPDC046870 TaxID=3155135 RepID=UPI003451510E